MRPWLVFLLFICFRVSATEATPAEVERATAQFRAFITDHRAEAPARVLGYLTTLRDDGTWADIDYHSRQRATWPTGSHITRALQMAIAWRRGGMNGAPPQVLLAAIHRALGNWRANDYQCLTNWWYNRIGGPQDILTMALLLGDALQPDEFTYVTQTVLPRAKIGMTGQNRVWLAGNTLMGGLLLRDTALVSQAATVIFSEVAITDKEGIQPDYSFHQHGPQQQFGNYGLSFAGEIAQWAAILRDTPWAMPAEKLDIFRRYLLDGCCWVLWRGTLDISACGRQLSPGSPAAKGASLLRVLAAMVAIDPSHAAEYTAAVNRNTPGAANDLLGNRYFWRSDYLIHRRPDFCVTLKLSSRRVIGSESLNGENLSGYYLADGACYVYRDGEEYKDIFPVWNWRQLPGVTCAQGSGPLPAFSTSRLPTSWLGGVSDGNNGGMAVDYTQEYLAGKKDDAALEHQRITAKKAWFYFADQVVCLGAGITASPDVADPLLTTVNQCLLRGPVRINAAGTVHELGTGTARPEALNWVEHDGVRYRFLTPQHVVVTVEPRTGNWRAVRNTSNIPRADITMNVFHLALEHGVHPEAGSYAYALQPANPDKQPEIELLQNTPKLQAVRVGSLLQAAFYTPGALTYAPNRSLSVDAPCLLLLDTAAHRAYLADPLQTRGSITLIVDAATYNIPLPRGDFKGNSQMVEVK